MAESAYSVCKSYFWGRVITYLYVAIFILYKDIGIEILRVFHFSDKDSKFVKKLMYLIKLARQTILRGACSYIYRTTQVMSVFTSEQKTTSSTTEGYIKGNSWYQPANEKYRSASS